MIWILTAIALLVAARAAYVLATYVILAYESAQAGFPHFRRTGPAWLTAFRMIYGVLFEIASSVLVLLAYPVRLLWRVKSGPAGPRRPVLLVHGMYVNGGALYPLRRRLRKAGWTSIHLLDLDFRRGHISTLSDQVMEKVEAILEDTGADRVDAIGHSLGAVVIFHTLLRAGGDRAFGTVVALGAPFHGTGMANFSASGLVRQLAPGSAVLADLRAKLDAPGAVPPTTRLVSIWSNFDNVVIPTDSPKLPTPFVESVRVDYLGHVSLLFSRTVARRIVNLLSGSI
jgi:triacylglycerol esterase/lipase EstA (alpha/beta hydrolase family)